jgi:hypothetical protein
MNVNGLNIDRRGGQFDTLCRMLKEVQADVYCGQEHNLDTTQPNIRKILYDTAAQHWDRIRLVLGTTPITFVKAYKPGGTMALTTGSLTGRVVTQTRDKWGRWVVQEFQGRHQRRLVIFSVLSLPTCRLYCRRGKNHRGGPASQPIAPRPRSA